VAEELHYEEHEVVLRVDFRDLDHDGCVTTSLRFLRGPRRPAAGETVYLLDRIGHGCVAKVVEVIGWSARIRPDWGSWLGDGTPPPEGARAAVQAADLAS
jgi:hypothetical protein